MSDAKYTTCNGRIVPILYQAMIPLEPKTKKNSQEIRFRKAGTAGFYKKTKYGLQYIGVPFIAQGEKYEQYETDAGWFLKPPAEPLSGRLNIRCIFYRDSRRRVDLTNLLEAIDDILIKYKIIKDDSFEIIAGHDGSRVLVDKEHPRTEIAIFELPGIE